MATRDDDPSVVVDQLFKAVSKDSPGASKVDLGDVIADIRINTSTQGASTLEVDVIDPQWELLTSGFVDVSTTGRMSAIDLNYPKDSDYWWRLTQADMSTDLTGPNLTLTFETRVVSYCREKTGAKQWSRSQYTRAQAIKAMTTDEIARTTPKPIFVSPELDIPQTIQAAS